MHACSFTLRASLVVVFCLAGCGSGGVAPHRAVPKIDYGGDPILKPVRVVTIAARNDPDLSRLFAFGDALVQSQWYKTVGSDYGLGAAGPSVHVTGDTILQNHAEFQDQEIKDYITTAITAAPGSPMPDGRSVFVLYLPPGIAVAGNGNCSAGYGGFHDVFSSKGDNFAVIQRCPGSDEDEFDSITIASSHEVLEAVTDSKGNGWGLQPVQPPWIGTVWATGDNGAIEENGDLCEGTRVKEGAFYYQRIFSNTAAAKGDDPCVPALPIPYYNITTSQDWYQAKAGTTVDIPITGWSTHPIPNWLLSTSVGATSDQALNFSAEIQRAGSMTVGKQSFATIDNAQVAQVAVQVPPNAVVGSWATVNLLSFRLASSTSLAPPPDDDDAHLWLVGVYVQ